MKAINRYIFKELLLTFFFALIAMTFLLIIVGLVREAMSENLPMWQIIELVPFVTVEMSRIAFPVTLLLAVTTFFAKMSGNNEVVALKSVGVPPWRFLWPVMVFGIMISLLTVWVNEMAVTWGRAGIASVIYNAAGDILLEKLRSTHTFATRTGDLKITVKGIENRRLISPTITVKNSQGSKGTLATIEARSAEMDVRIVEKLIRITLTDVKAENQGKFKVVDAERTFDLPLDRVTQRSDNTTKRPSDLGLSEIYSKIDDYVEDGDTLRREIAARRAFASSLGAVHLLATPDLNRQKYLFEENQRLINRLKTEIPRRWATGFSCLCFIWLGAPLAIWMKKSDIFASFFACFTPILLLYYPLLMFGLQGAKKGSLPPDFVWTANISLIMIGFWFLRRIHRY